MLINKSIKLLLFKIMVYKKSYLTLTFINIVRKIEDITKFLQENAILYFINIKAIILKYKIYLQSRPKL